jgi:hypothetical protein
MSEQQWTFREIMLIALIREAGHTPVPHGSSFVKCTRCNIHFDVGRRALTLANGERWQGATSSYDPLAFARCWPVRS